MPGALLDAETGWVDGDGAVPLSCRRPSQLEILCPRVERTLLSASLTALPTWRFWFRRPIRPGIGSPVIDARLRVVQDSLSTPHASGVFPIDLQDVSHGSQFVANLGLHA